MMATDAAGKQPRTKKQKLRRDECITIQVGDCTITVQSWVVDGKPLIKTIVPDGVLVSDAMRMTSTGPEPSDLPIRGPLLGANHLDPAPTLADIE
jgi:hypothetical protein